MISPAEKRAQELSKDAQASFAEHMIVRRSTGRWLLKKPGTGIFWVEVVELAGGYLLVHGDIDCIVFGVYIDPCNPGERVRWMASRSRGDDAYLIEKATIGMGMRSDELLFDYSPEQFRWQLEELRALESEQELHIDDDDVSAPSTLDAYDDALACYLDEGPQAAQRILANAGIEAEDLPDGRVISARPVFAHAALRRLAELLDTEEP